MSLSLSGRAARAFNFARSAFVNGGRVSGVHLAIFVFIAQFFFAGKSLGIELDVLEVESIFGGKSFDVFSWTFRLLWSRNSLEELLAPDVTMQEKDETKLHLQTL